MRRRIRWIGLLLLVAAVGHWAYWYRPRERVAAPSSETPAGALYSDGDLPYRVWLPFPHQNLARLQQAIGDVDRFSRAVARLSGRELPRLPKFGASRVPPSSELALAFDETGERFVAVARVYPVAGFLARWAGRLAGNPLLAGGDTVLDGRPVSVSWDGGSWTVATRKSGVPAVSRRDRTGPSSTGTALAWTRLAIPRGYLPAGEYRLQRLGPALELVAGEAAGVSRLRALDDATPPVPLVLAELDTAAKLKGRALALIPGVESIAGLPGAVTVHRGHRRWKVPGERLLKLVGDGPPTAEVGGWIAAALEPESLRHAAALGGFIDSLEGTAISTGVWIDIAAARRLVAQTAEALEAVPVVGRREARRWRALEVALEPLAGSDWLIATIVAEPPTVRVRLGAEPPRTVD